MAQILDSLPPEQSGKILCCYINATSKIQVARISNVPNWYFERVIFPGQRLVFEAPKYAQMEIHTGMMASSILSDTIPCERLCIADEMDDDLEDEEQEAIAILEPVEHHVTEKKVKALQTALSETFLTPLITPILA